MAAVEMGIRLIGVDRPGMGLSTPHQFSQLVDFSGDIQALLERIGVEELGVVGLSGGGPYTLALAHDMPERVRAVVVLGGVAPSVGPEAADGGIVSLAARFQPALKVLRDPVELSLSTVIRAVRPLGHQALHLYARVSPIGDRRLLLRPEFEAMFLDDLMGGRQWRLRAPFFDAVLFGREWGFNVRDVTIPVEWWHGDADHIIPFRHGEHMVSLLPNAHLHVQHGESHLGGLGEAVAVLESLMQAWDARDEASLVTATN
jgi:pimeloyl-ACP methyl ester carboxylesterase